MSLVLVSLIYLSGVGGGANGTADATVGHQSKERMRKTPPTVAPELQLCVCVQTSRGVFVTTARLSPRRLSGVR